MIAEGVLTFGLSPDEVGELTYKEYNTLMMRHNLQERNGLEMQRNVMLNAIINAFRKKNARFLPLFEEENKMTTEEIIQERHELFGRNELT